ncbi:MAG: class I SAM-dependent methyltransferase [Candidatus Sumerlaeota bacterium]|nr:class I SAM-dependent methyltransferase [Candidatus Sumerlaeota bacterium]
MLRWFKNALKRAPGLKPLIAERDRLRRELDDLRAQWGFAAPGHFYSPIPSLEDVRRDEAAIFAPASREAPGIPLHEQEQLSLVGEFKRYYDEYKFPAHKILGRRYYYGNPDFIYTDAFFLHVMTQRLRPKRIIEVGCGYSSCVILDANEQFFDHSINVLCIDPHPELLLSLITEEDKARIRLAPNRVQDVDLREFDALEANDILFIDSSHVAKVGSDVNRLLFEVLPRLAQGTHVHFHDMGYPFEYPKEWVYEGRAWNEAYLVRAFLQYNDSFRIVLMSAFLQRFHARMFQDDMPLCWENPGGSLWIRKER